jgi:phosphatidylinositol alpha-mannosyltransferase
MAHFAAELAVGSRDVMKIAVVCPYSIEIPGGVQSQAIGLAEGIRSAGHEAWLVAPGVTGPPETRLLGRSVGVRVNGSVAPLALHPATVGRVRRAVADADVVHVHEPLALLASPAAFLGHRPPAVGTFHADPSSTIRNLYRLAGPGLRRILAGLQVVTAVSRAAASAVEQLVDECIIIPNAVDTRSFSVDSPRRPHRVVFVGRDEPRKGLDVLLAAWPLVRAEVSDAELVVLGPDRAGSSESIRYLGVSVGEEKRRHLAEAAIYCGPNLGRESFGIGLVEAMAAGCAPVVSDLPAFRAVAGATARYVPTAHPRRLADELIASLRDTGGTQARGRQAVLAAEAYDWRHILPKYLDIYARIAQ